MKGILIVLAAIILWFTMSWLLTENLAETFVEIFGVTVATVLGAAVALSLGFIMGKGAAHPGPGIMAVVMLMIGLSLLVFLDLKTSYELGPIKAKFARVDPKQIKQVLKERDALLASRGMVIISKWERQDDIMGRYAWYVPAKLWPFKAVR